MISFTQKHSFKNGSPIRSIVAKLGSMLLVLLLCSRVLVAANTYAQNTKMSINMKDVSMVQVIDYIKSVSDFSFMYKDADVNKIDKISVNMTNATVSDILNECLGNTPYTYKIDDLTISIVKAAAEAQDAEVVLRGVVLDQNKKALEGATLVVQGSTNYAITNEKGIFELKGLKKGQVIVVSFLGMLTQNITYNGQTNLNIIMVEDNAEVKELVVTGYANIKKESFTGSSTSVSKEELLRVSPTNILKALSAFDPSIKIVQNNEMGSDPNTMPEYYIHGRSGISEIKELDIATGNMSEFALKNNPSAPIFILDGFEVGIDKIVDMDMNRVERINILKDAAATAVYGSRAANGVIVIETVAPAAGKVQVSYSGTYTLSTPDLSSYDIMNAEEALLAEYYGQLYYDKTDSQGKNSSGYVNYATIWNNVTRGIDTDWLSKPLQNEFSHRHYLYLNGGNNEFRWNADLNYQKNGGVMKGSTRNTYGAAMTLDYRHKGLQIKNKMTVSGNDSENSPYGTFSDYVAMKPYIDPVDETTGQYQKIFAFYRNIPNSISASPTYVNNPLYEATLNSYNKSGYKDFIDNLGINWKFTDYLQFRANLGVSIKQSENEAFIDPRSGDFQSSDVTKKGSLSLGETKSNSWNANAMLAFNKSIAGHNLNLTWGVEASESKQESTNSQYTGFVEGGIPSIANAMDILKRPSYSDANTRRFGTYLQFNYTYNNIYLLDVSGRYDGSSSFGTDKKMGLFWSGGIGMNIHNYEFMKNQNVVNKFKLRATYGHTGKANFSPYQARTTYQTNYDEIYIDQWGMGLKALGNSDLLWEKVKKLNAGVEAMFFNKLSVIFDWYKETTVDQVTSVTIPSSSGFTSYTSNMGEIQNKGIDLRLNFHAYQNKDWDVYLTANLNHNSNKITKIGEALEDYNKRIDQLHSGYNSLSTDPIYQKPFTKYEVGNSLTAIYGMKSLGIDPSTGREILVKRDGSVLVFAGDWSSAEQQCLGDTEAKIAGNAGFNIRWKNWTLYTSFTYRWGGQAYNQTMAQLETLDLVHLNGDRRVLTMRWKQAGDIQPLKALSANYQTRPTSRFVQDDNQFTLSSASLGYTFSNATVKNWGMSSIRLQLNTSDIFALTSIKRERGTSYPYARTFNFSLNITL